MSSSSSSSVSLSSLESWDSDRAADEEEERERAALAAELHSVERELTGGSWRCETAKWLGDPPIPLARLVGLECVFDTDGDMQWLDVPPTPPPVDAATTTAAASAAAATSASADDDEDWEPTREEFERVVEAAIEAEAAACGDSSEARAQREAAETERRLLTADAWVVEFLTDVPGGGLTLSLPTGGMELQLQLHLSAAGRLELVSGSLQLVLTKVPGRQRAHQRSLSLARALDESLFTDAVVVTPAGTKIAVHRQLLELRCPALTLDSPCTALGTVSDATARALVHFLYTDGLPDAWESSEQELLGLAKALGLPALFQRLAQQQQADAHQSDLGEAMADLQLRVGALVSMLKGPWMRSAANIELTFTEAMTNAAVGILDLLVVSEEYNFTKSSMSRPERTRIMGELHTLLADTMAALPGLLENYVQQLAALSPAEQQVFGSTLCPRIMALNELCTRGFAMLLRALKAAAKLLVQRQSGISRLRKAMKLHSMFDAGSVMEFAAQMVDSLSYYRNRLAALDEAARLERLLATFEKHVEQAESEWHLPTKYIQAVRGMSDTQWRKQVKVYSSHITYGLRQLRKSRAAFEPLLELLLKSLPDAVLRRRLQQLDLLPSSAQHADPTTSSPSSPSLPASECAAAGAAAAAPAQPTVSASPPNTASTLAEMKQLLADRERSGDMVLMVEAGTQRLRCHRFVLAARCAHFHRVLLSRFAEASACQLDFPEASQAAMEAMLRFIYTGEADFAVFPLPDFAGILELCELLELDDLKAQAGVFLQRAMNADNVVFLLSIADAFRVGGLRESCIYFLATHREARQDECFEELPDELKMDVLAFVQGIGADGDGGGNAGDESAAAAAAAVALAADAAAIFSADQPSREAREQLRGVLGPDPPDAMLDTLLVAANNNIERAVHYFFSSQ